MTTQIDNKFISSFSFWILDSGVTNHICSSLAHFTYIIKLILFVANDQMEIKSLPNILEIFSQSKPCHRQC